MNFYQLSIELAILWSYGFIGLLIVFLLSLPILDEEPTHYILKLYAQLVAIIGAISIILFIVGLPGMLICVINGWHI